MIIICFYLSITLSVPFQKENIGDLLIVNAQLSQAGIYACTAQTVVDSASASAKLVVRGKIHQRIFYYVIQTNAFGLQEQEKTNLG